MLVVSNQQESKVPHGVRTFANQSTIHGETGSMKFNLKIVAATAAVAMMSSGAAHGAGLADVDVTPAGTYNYSKEALSLSGTTGVSIPDVVVTFGNALTYQDDIFITLPGTISVALVPSPGLVVCTSLSPTVPSVGYVTTVNGGWAFRITSVNGVTIGDKCTFTGLTVQGASLANSSGVINYQANRFQTGQLVDTASNNTSIFVVSEFGFSIPTTAPATVPDRLNGIINVYADRESFLEDETVPPGDAYSPANQADTLNFTTSTNGTNTAVPTIWATQSPRVTVSGSTILINGDFAWIDSDNDGACEPGEFNAAIAYAGYSAQLTSTCNQLVWSGPTVGTTSTGFFKVPGNKILNPTDWTATVEWQYYYQSTNNNAKTGFGWDPGIWTINGAQVYIQYMPYGTNISRIVYAANSGLINADATADIYFNGSITKCPLGAVNNRRVTELSGPINTCAATALGSATSGKVAILLTFTAPDKDIEVYSAYNVGGNDRGSVVNTSNGRTFFSGLGFSPTPPVPPVVP